MKQTAVEWMVKELYTKFEMRGNGDLFDEILKQAKEIEKEQMKSASCPYIGGWEDDEFEYWYNEKYKK